MGYVGLPHLIPRGDRGLTHHAIRHKPLLSSSGSSERHLSRVACDQCSWSPSRYSLIWRQGMLLSVQCCKREQIFLVHLLKVRGTLFHIAWTSRLHYEHKNPRSLHDVCLFMYLLIYPYHYWLALFAPPHHKTHLGKVKITGGHRYCTGTDLSLERPLTNKWQEI